MTISDTDKYSDRTVFRKTIAGKNELVIRSHALDQRQRRTLILVDGTKDLAEMSAMLRPGEIELVFPHLHRLGLIEMVAGDDAGDDHTHVAKIPAARDPGAFLQIRSRTVARVRQAFGENATRLVGEIEGAQSAEELRIKLRSLENIFTKALGKDEGITLAREIGHELLVLVPQAG